MEEVANENRKLVVSPGNEGADSHSIGTNLHLMAQLVFDWLDEALNGAPAVPSGPT